MAARLALHVPIGDALTRRESVDLVRRAEELGYESAWFGESWGYDAFTTLTEVAVQTSTIGLGTHIATIFSRTPSMMAQSAASLDLISGGRLTLGLGTSGPIVVERWHGHRWEAPLQRTREYVEIVRLALSGERVDYQGELFQLSGFRLRMKPLRARVPIFIASIGPRNVALTGEIADGWLPIFTAEAVLPGLLETLRGAAAEAGRDAGALEIAPSYLTAVAADPAEARAQARGHVAFYVGGMGTFYRRLMERAGFAEEAARVREAWAQPGREGRAAAAAEVTDAMLDAMTLVGTRSQVTERLERLRAAGVTLPVLMAPFGAGRSLIEDTLAALAAP